MSDKLQNLQECLAAKVAELDKILAIRDRELSEEEVARVEAITAEIEQLKSESELEERRQQAKAEAHALREAVTKPRRPQPERTAVVERVHESAKDSPTWNFRDKGDYLASVQQFYESRGANYDTRLKIGAAITGMGTTVNPDGGFAVPPEYDSNIWSELDLDGLANLVSNTDQYSVSGRSLTLLANAETSRATGSRYGGIRGYRVNEGGTLTASKPTLREISIKPGKIAVLAYMTEELIEQEQANLGQWLFRAATSELNFIINDEIINGTGTGQMLGILNAGCTTSVAKETGQAAATINATNIDKMWMNCHPRARGGAVWYINPEIEPQLAGLNRSVGTAGDLVYNPPGGLSAAPYATLKGRPVVATEWNAALGTVGDIILANLGYYLTAVRGGVRSESSMHVAFLTDQMCFRFIYQIGGQPWLESAITPYKGSQSWSPFVTLATRS